SGDRPAGAPSSSEKPEDKDPTKPAAGPKKEKEPVKIDLAGIDQRILAFPLPAGNYVNLQAGAANQIFYMARPENATPTARRSDGPPTGSALHRYDLEKRKDDTVQPAVMMYELTPDGKKMLYATSPTTFMIGAASPNPMAAMMAAAGGGGGRGAGPNGPGGD